MQAKLLNFGSWISDRFWSIAFLVLAMKLFLAAVFPITADEAYFWQWGKNLDFTFYDHSLITGIWVYLGQLFGDHIFFPRAVSILSQGLVFFGLLKVVEQISGERAQARLAALAFLVSPLHLLFFMISTDSPLFFFSFFSIIFFAFGFQKEKPSLFWLSGIFLGLAFLSKYLVFFLGFAFFMTTFFVKSKKKIPIIWFSFLLGLIPFVWLGFDFAKESCWWPLQFNLFNRTGGKAAGLGGILSFLLQQLFLLTPWLAFYLWKDRSHFAKQFLQGRHCYLVVFIFSLVPIGLLSYFSTGLHWGLSLYPLVYLSLWILNSHSLKKAIALSAVLSLMLFSTALTLLTLVPSVYVGGRYFSDYVMGNNGDQVHAKLVELSKDLNDPVFGTLGYTTSGLMDYHSKTHYLVFKDVDNNGRNDDKWTDYSKLNGKDFILISTYKYSTKEMDQYSQFFDSIEYQDIQVANANFYVAKGRGFQFEAYRDLFLTWVKKKFYRFRPWLPEGQCFFNERYFSSKD